jgi:hypothetical protein
MYQVRAHTAPEITRQRNGRDANYAVAAGIGRKAGAAACNGVANAVDSISGHVMFHGAITM